MADRKPLKVLPDSASGTGGGDSTGIGEFVEADTLGVVDGGTGLGTVATSNILTGNGTSALSAESNLTFDGSTLAITGSMTLSSTSTISGDMTFVDNAKVTLGTGGDADIYYDATDLIINPKVAGSGKVGIGNTTPTAHSNNSLSSVVIGTSAARDGLSIITATTGKGQIAFGDGDSDASGGAAEWQGLVEYNHSSDAMAFYTVNTSRMTINSGGTVLIPTVNGSPSLDLGVAGTSNSLIATPESMYFSIDSNNDQTDRAYYFGHNANTTSATTLMKIQEDGNVSIADGNLVISTAGHGIDFSATSDGAGTDTSELLDDYEEGTFTPVLRYSTSSYSFSSNEGRYVKIGRLVWFSASMTITNAAVNNGTDTLNVIGLPYTIENNNPAGHARSICSIQRYTGGSNVLNTITYGEINGVQLNILKIYNNGASWAGVPSSEFYESSGNNNVFLTGCYFAT